MMRVVIFGLLAASFLAPTAWADDIVYRDPNTCAETTVRGVTLTGETWTEVKYREKKRGPDKSIPAASVMEIRRDDKGAGARALKNAIGELNRGKVKEARMALKQLSGGSWKQDEQGRRFFQSFAAQDPSKKGKRPPWTSEYAHFYYIKALYEDGVKSDDDELLEEAWLALVDQKAPGGKDDATTGGFLKRFDGGNSRFYAEAMLLKAMVLQAQGKLPQAVQAYKDLEEKAAALDVGPKWAFEAKLGPARVAEAQGKYLDAINKAGDVSTMMRLMLRDEGRDCFRRELGRYFNRARMKQASIRLEQAEKNRSPAEFRKLREFIEKSTPDALARSFSTLPRPQMEALVAGAMDPRVQAVMQNGLGLAYLNEKRFEDAIHAFRAVEVKYFQDASEHARALHYLALAAQEAAKKASSPEAKKLYELTATRAKTRLQAEHPNSRWAKEG